MKIVQVRGVCFHSFCCCSQVQGIVDDYKNANLTISRDCKKISEMLLVKIDGKRVYDNLEFEEEQVSVPAGCAPLKHAV